ncbi:NMD3 [Cordylochernes scorpioides]|uniref:60S ribosomal export protein NMD3 n=1 Tax=Cordylochernes scorpioides TaxID=51811 RepID=A0ABY6KJB8_9ARAC|nr:NMD3 [Cordylochernes scorpioides]
MEPMACEIEGTVGTVLCCMCQRQILPNDLMMCFECGQSFLDITKHIPRNYIIGHCRGCDRYLDPPAFWVKCALQSSELLKLCLKKIRGLDKVRVTDVMFLFTEEHSRRIKLKLQVVDKMEEDAQPNKKQFQYEVVIEFIVQNQICVDCQKREAKNFWKAKVQVRQKVNHKKTFFYLEQLILKHNIPCASVKHAPNGLDFLFDRHDSASKFAQFVENIIPAKRQFSKKLISEDFKNNVKDYKTTFIVEIIPICKDDIICLPISIARSLGNIGQICLCLSVTSKIKIIDPITTQVAEIDAQRYWRNPFNAVTSVRNLQLYMVENIEINHENTNIYQKRSKKHVPTDVWVIKYSEIGTDANPIHTRSHLGYILKPNDIVLGFDLQHCNVNNKDLDMMDEVPDVILVKKVYADRMTRRKKRTFKLERIPDMKEEDTVEDEFCEFLEDLEEDPQLRSNVNLYKDPQFVEEDLEVDEECPMVELTEMLDALVLDDD